MVAMMIAMAGRPVCAAALKELLPIGDNRIGES